MAAVMAAVENLSWRVVLTIEATALVCGTVYSLTRKFMNLTKAEGFAGNTTYFRHPLFQGLWCFLGQLLAWPIWWRMEQRERRRRQAAGGTRDVPLGEQPTSRRAAVLCMLPTLFDVIGTVLNNIGLILTSVSVYQMLRGSVVLFTSLASRLLLKTRFTTKQLQGLVMIAIGVCFIGLVRTCCGIRIRRELIGWCIIGITRTSAKTGEHGILRPAVRPALRPVARAGQRAHPGLAGAALGLYRPTLASYVYTCPYSRRR